MNLKTKEEIEDKRFSLLFKEGQESQKFRVRLLTYNLFMRPPPITSNQSDYKEERLIDFVKTQMQNFDIICAQELFGLLNNRKTKFINEAQKRGYEYHHRTDPLSFFSKYLVDSGLVTVSRFPIHATDFKAYDNTVLIDSIARKGVMYSQIKIEDHFLHLFTTHTQSTHIGFQGSDLERISTIRARARQFKIASDFIKESIDKNGFNPNDLVIFCGDMNVDKNHAEFPIDHIKNAKDLIKYFRGKDHFNEYDLMIHQLENDGKFSVIDYLKLSHRSKKYITFADTVIDEEGKSIPKDTVLTSSDDWHTEQALDYIFELVPKYSPAKISRGTKLVFEGKSIEIDEMEIKGRPYRQLSDHYGIKGLITLKDVAGINLGRLRL